MATGMKECPADGCVKVQVMSNRLEDSVSRATECLESFTDANQNLMVTLQRVTTLLESHAERFKEGNLRFDRMDAAIQALSTDVTTLKAHEPQKGASTVAATSISTAIATAAIGVIEWLRANP